MNCESFEKWIYLYKNGELTFAEKTRLNAHLSTCKTCSAKFGKIPELQSFLKKLKDVQPGNDKAQEIKNNILQKISVSHDPNYSIEPILRRRISLISHPVFRFITTAAAIFLLALFIRQQIEIKKELQILRSKLEQNDKTNKLNSGEVGNADFMLLLKNYSLFRNKDFSREEIMRFTKKNQQLIEDNEFILDYLQKNYPDIFNEIMEKHRNRNKFLQNL